MSAPHVLVCIPVYDHAASVGEVARGVLAVHPHLLVVDDGSAKPVAPLLPEAAESVRHEANLGKGAAIRTAADFAAGRGYTHLVTIDADGQHDPADIPRFLAAIRAEPEAIIVGKRDFETANVPASSRFGRAFSNFWLRVQTGERIGDVQSGFRAYPVAVLTGLAFREPRYAFEVEVLAKAAWAGFPLREIDVFVHYPEKSERVSHFDKFADNVRISLLNTRLTARAFVPLPHRRFELDHAGEVSPIHPVRSLKLLLAKNETPHDLALAAGLGMVLGTWPLIGLHSIAIVMVCGFFGLSRITGLAASQLCIPPIVPALAIEAGHFLRHGEFLTEISLRTLGYQFLERVWEWILGSLVLGPLLGALVGAAVYVLARILRRAMRRAGEGSA